MSSLTTPENSAVRQTIGWTIPARDTGRADPRLYCEECTINIPGAPESVTAETAQELRGDQPVYCDECDRLLLDGYTEL